MLSIYDVLHITNLKSLPTSYIELKKKYSHKYKKIKVAFQQRGDYGALNCAVFRIFFKI